MNNERESLLNARTISLANAEATAEKLKCENNILKDNNYVLMQKNTNHEKLLKEIKSLSESNTYSNADIRLKKIKELVSTAIIN